MKLPRAILGLSVLALVPAIVFAATNSDVQFRDCMRTATINYQNRLVEVQDLFNVRRIQAAIDRRSAMVDSWNIDDDRTRNTVQREIDRNIRNRERDADRLLRDDQRNAQTDFRNAERFCRDQLRQRDRDRRSGIIF